MAYIAVGDDRESVLDVLKTDEYKAVEYILHYGELRREYYEKCQEILYGSPIPQIGHSSTPGNPTLAKVGSIKANDEMLRWLLAVEKMEQCLGPKKTLFLRLRRESMNELSKRRGRPGWVDYTVTKYEDETGGNLSDKTAREWWKDIKNLTIRIATKITLTRE